MLIISDLDGVWLNADWRQLYRAYVTLIIKTGKDYRDFFGNLEEFKRWWSPDWQLNYKKLGIIDPEIPNRIFYQIYEPCVYLFPWAKSVAEKLARRHLLTVCTNGLRKNAERYMAPMRNYVSLVVGKEDVRKVKPDPEGIKLILKKTGFKAADALMIGDTPEDITAGKLAGTKTGAVKWGLGEWDELLALAPDYHFEEYWDFLRQL